MLSRYYFLVKTFQHILSTHHLIPLHKKCSPIARHWFPGTTESLHTKLPMFERQTEFTLVREKISYSGCYENLYN